MKMTSKRIARRFRGFARAAEAVAAMEYAILVGVVVVAIAAAVATFSEQISDAMEAIGDDIGATSGAGTPTLGGGTTGGTTTGG